MRCYNGAPDSEMQAMLDRQAALMKRIRGAEPGAHCTYFPVEGTYQVHVWGRAISGMHWSRESALLDAARSLRCD